MKILVTGGAGFIGSAFVRNALKDGFGLFDVQEVRVIDALTYAGRRENLAQVNHDPRLSFIHASICDPESVKVAAQGVDLVVNFAAESHVDRSILGPSKFALVNTYGASIVFDVCRRLKTPRLVQVSTDEVYGSIEQGSWTEDWPLQPNSPYAASKASADLLALSMFRTYDLPVSITRCSNNYGPFQFPEKLIPLFATNLIRGLRLPLYGDGMNVREWIHVDDHCQGIALVAAHGQSGHVYNIGGGSEKTNQEITNQILDLMQADRDAIQHVADRLGHDRRYSIDDTKIRTELGFQPRVSFDEGLERTIDWYRRNESWWRPLVD